jgi:transcriptional regulator with XRE-family HTH domain
MAYYLLLLFMPYKHIRKQIREARIQKGISQKEMAEKLCMDARSYQRIEYGEKKELDVIILFRIARILNLNMLATLKEILPNS